NTSKSTSLRPKTRHLRPDTRHLPIHHCRYRDPQHAQRADQLAAHNRNRRQQKILPALVGFVQDRMPVVEVVEQLCQQECVLREIRWLGGGDALVDEVVRLGCSQPELPYLVPGFAAQILLKILGRGGASRVPTERIGIEASFAEDAGRAHASVLRVRAGFASKLNASLKSNAITDGLVYFSMK